MKPFNLSPAALEQAVIELRFFQESDPILFQKIDSLALEDARKVFEKWQRLSKSEKAQEKNIAEANHHYATIIYGLLGLDNNLNKVAPVVIRAIERNFPITLYHMLQANPNLVNLETTEGFTPLMLAIMSNKKDLVEACLHFKTHMLGKVDSRNRTVNDIMTEEAIDPAIKRLMNYDNHSTEKSSSHKGEEALTTFKNVQSAAVQPLASPQKKAWPDRIFNTLSDAIDYSNRVFFEGLLDFFFSGTTGEAYRSITRGMGRYDEEYGVASYILGLITRIILLPITASIYTLSRLSLIVLNPWAYRHNFFKATLMAITTLTVAAIVAGLTPLLTTSTLHILSAAFGVAAGAHPIAATAVGVIILVSTINIALAFLLHGAKTLAQTMNRQERVEYIGFDAISTPSLEKNSHIISSLSSCRLPGHYTITAPKHQHLRSGEIIPEEVKIAHQNLVTEYYGATKRKAAIWGIHFSIPHAEKTYKGVLYQFESLLSGKTKITQNEWDALCQNTKTHPGFRCDAPVSAALEKFKIDDNGKIVYKPVRHTVK